MATANEKSALHEILSKDSGDAGSPEVQVALLTARINELTPYFKANPKSQQGRRGLLKMVNKRKQMLSYLKSKDQERYNELIRKLGLRPERPPSKMLDFKTESPRSLPVATNEDAPSMDKSEHSPHIGYEVANKKYGLQIAFASGRNPPLTPNLLVETVAPLIQAVFQLQRTMQPKQHVKQRIARVSQSSPIEVALEGVADAYKALREDIIPWRRRHQQELAELAAAEQTQDIARKKAEVALAEAQTATQLGEARKAMAESEKIEQEVEAARFALNRAKFEFIVEMAAKMLPNGSDIERIELVTRLLPNVETLLFSSAEIRPLIGTSGPGPSPTSEA